MASNITHTETDSDVEDIEDIPVKLDECPSFEDQKSEIHSLLLKPLQKGDKWFLIHVRWFKQWKRFVGFDSCNRLYAGVESVRPGPIDNSSLFVNQKLRRHQVEDEDYKLVPEEAWRKLVEWYGMSPDSVPICRRVIEYGQFVKECKVEIYPLELKACIYPNQSDFKIVQIFRSDFLDVLEWTIRKTFWIIPEKEVRIYNWCVMTCAYELIEDLSYQVEDVGLCDGQRIMMELQNPNGSWPRVTQRCMQMHACPLNFSNSKITSSSDESESEIVNIPVKLAESPSFETQKSEIHSLLSKRFAIGDKWFLVHIYWFKHWKQFVGFDTCNRSNAGNESIRPGPIDNSSLLENQELRKHQVENIDYKLVPEEAWRKLGAWYGITADSVPICRRVIEYGRFVKQCKIEVYLIELNARLYPNENVFKIIRISCCDTIHVLEKKMRKAFLIGPEKEVRIYNITYTYELIKGLSREVQDVGLFDDQCVLMEVRNQDGSWPRNPQQRLDIQMPTSYGSYSKSSISRQLDNYVTDSGIEGIPFNMDGCPSYKVQMCQMNCYLSKPIQTGQKWFLVGTHWYKQWERFVGYDSKNRYYAGNELIRPGPIDNFALLENQKLVNQRDYKLVPEEAWRSLVEWYGIMPDSVPICRRIISDGKSFRQINVEIYPFELKAYLYPNQRDYKIVRISRFDTIKFLVKKMRIAFRIDPEKAVCIYNWDMVNNYKQIEGLSHQVQDVGLSDGQCVLMEVTNQDGSCPCSI